jgi:uncharacterized lipoprotein YajG
MKSTIKIMLMLATAFVLSACASPPSRIAPVAVATSEYDGLSCSQLASELARVSTALEEAERRQRNAVAGDALTVFLVLVPASALAGDSEAEVARLKGEEIAITNSLARRNC